MTNTSATGGFLSPLSTPAPLEDQALADFFQQYVAGITGIAGNLVRPRWQAEPPNIPQVGVTWASIGVMSREADVFAYTEHSPAGNGSDKLQRHEIFNMLVSFYGDNADSMMSSFRDGMQIAQNREILTLNNMGLMSSEDIIAVPSIIKEKWLYRVDMRFKIKRQILRTYSVETLLSADIKLYEDTPPPGTVTDIPVTQ